MARAVKKAERAPSAADQAYNGIIDLVLRHELRPGERTSVSLLAARLELGRTPIKEAIIRLQTEGVLSVTGQSGTMVNKFDYAQSEHLFAVRSLFEGFAADAAARKVTPEQLVRLRELLSDMRRYSMAGADLRSAADFVRANVAFHELIVAATGNVFLVRLYAQIQMQMQIVTYLILRGQDPRAAAQRQRQHDGIYKALAAHNGKLLKSLLRAHAQNTETEILTMLKASAEGGEDTRRRWRRRAA